jgi:endo-1,4-beta-xylanase
MGLQRFGAITFKEMATGRSAGYFGRLARLGLVVLSFHLIGACRIAAIADIEQFEKNSARTEKNKTALIQAQANIEKYRKGAVRIKVIDASGRPVANARLDIRQVTHAFKFGCYLKIDDLDQAKLPDYERRFAALFNYAVIGTYWDNIENKQGVENWSWFDREVALSTRLGLGVQAAPVLWGTNEFGSPRWLPREKEALLAILERRVRSSTARNASVADWEIVNEPLAPKKDMFAQIVGDEYVASGFVWAREAAPGRRLLINEYGVFGSLGDHNYNRKRYYELLKQLIEKDVPVDVIGIQAHSNGEWFEPANVAEQLEKYAVFGKPLQITEFSAQTFNFNNRRSPLAISGTYRGGVWDGEKQAEFYREFYTIGFGNPSVEAIITWGLDDERAWLPGIGLIDRNGQPKPAYGELDRLINHEWKSRLEENTNEGGTYDLRAFFGMYEITATSPAGKTVKSVFNLEKDKANVWVIRLDL